MRLTTIRLSAGIRDYTVGIKAEIEREAVRITYHGTGYNLMTGDERRSLEEEVLKRCAETICRECGGRFRLEVEVTGR